MSFRQDCEVAITALEDFARQAEARQAPVIHQVPMPRLAQRLDLERLIREGGLHGPALERFLGDYLDASTRLRHPGFMAHQVAVPQPLAAVASLIDGFTNNAMAIYEMGPAASTVEFAVINWMLGKIGWRPMPLPGADAPSAHGGGVLAHGGGVLTHGGSLANLTALAAARGRAAPTAWEDGTPDHLVLIASPHCHYSISRAAGLLGLGRKAVRAAPTDALGRLEPEPLGELIDELRREGQEPLAVVANACATASGLYDPLRAIATICRARGVWLHVDGAHGASALVSARHRALLDGVELADSLVWDAHKMLRAPTVCAAVLTLDHRDLDGAFREEASYLFHDKDQPGFDFIHRTVECTKAALGLKVFFALAAEGEAGIESFIDRQTDLARTAAAWLAAQPEIEVAVTPESNILCFRLAGDDALQLEIRKRLTEAGRHYISATEFAGRRWLRLALMNPATDMADIESLLRDIRGHRAAL